MSGDTCPTPGCPGFTICQRSKRIGATMAQYRKCWKCGAKVKVSIPARTPYRRSKLGTNTPEHVCSTQPSEPKVKT